MGIPFLDLKAQYHRLQPSIDAAIQRVLEGGHFILGTEVSAFESEFAAFCGTREVVAVANGTEAIQLALLACGIEPLDEVITTAFTAVATVAAIESTGACPVLVDINPDTYNMDADCVSRAVTSRTRAIVPVHLYGFPADLAPILEIAHQSHLLIVEDCAQAHGASYGGRRVGSWGQAGTFSFYPTKNLGAYGDGGAVITDDTEIAKRLRRLRQYGWAAERISELKGINSRMDELQAAILRVKLADLAYSNARRVELANLYRLRLAGTSYKLPVVCADSEPVYHNFVIRHSKRDALRNFLNEQGIATLVHYPVPIHLQKGYLDLGYPAGCFPQTESASNEVLSLPLYPEMTPEMIEQVCQSLLAFPG